MSQAKTGAGRTTTFMCRASTPPAEGDSALHWSWSYPWEANRDLTELDNLLDDDGVRQVLWPSYESIEYSRRCSCGDRRHAGAFHLSIVKFQALVGEVTGHPCRTIASIRSDPDCRSTKRARDTDTLMVFGLDHGDGTRSIARGDRGRAQFLTREGTCLIIGPTTTSGPRRISSSVRWSMRTTVTRWCRASSASGDTHGRS